MTSAALSCCLAVLHVLPLQFVRGGPRDQASTVLRRAVAVAVSTCLSVLCVQCTRSTASLAWLGLRWDWGALALGLSLYSTLFLGPLVCAAADCVAGAELPRLPAHLLLRNLVIAPLTEEIVFRACICTLLLSQRVALARVILLSPALFSAVHLHHVREAMCYKGKSLWQALLAPHQLFQALYTWVFGVLAAFAYLRSGSLLAPLVLHAACNYSGLPRPPRHAAAALVHVGGLCSFTALVAYLATGPYLHSEL